MNADQDVDLIVQIRQDAQNLISGALEALNKDLPGAEEYFALLSTVNTSYKVFIDFLKERSHLGTQDVVLISNCIHAWKSEKFILNEFADLDKAVEVLNKAREEALHGRMITVKEFEALVDLTHDYCVSMATKLLHLVAPNMYAILDKHIYKYLLNEEWDQSDKATKITQAFTYWDLLNDLIERNNVTEIQHAVSRWLDYDVAKARAIELVWYVRSKLTSLASEAGRAVKEPEPLGTLEFA